MLRSSTASLQRMLALSFVLLVSWVSSAHAVTVEINPPDTTVYVGDTFLLRSVTGPFPDLKAYELIYQYGAVLQYLGPIAGDVLTGNGNPYVVNSIPDNNPPPDQAGVDCAQLVNSTSGPGVLIYFQFKALAVGDSPIDCVNVDFRDSFNNQTIPTCVGGMVHVIEHPTPTRRSSWGQVKILHR